MDLTQILNKLIDKQNLTTEETELLLKKIIEGKVSSAQISAILVALRIKGETSDEIVGFIKAMRKNMIHVNFKNAVDVCGTGGDNSGTFNISTAVAFVIAGAGVKIAKHGNRAASSKCGSADVLEALGVNLKLSSQEAKDVFNKVGMIFLFAPLFHPAIKNVISVREELKIRTVFNYLGPFANPASVERQLIGVPNIEIARKLAEGGRTLGYKHLLIVTSEDGLDEISISSKTQILEIKEDTIKQYSINPTDYGFKKTAIKEILGGTAKENADIIKQVLLGAKNPKRDIVILNSAFALFAADAVDSINKGIKHAEKSIDSGQAALVLENLVKETQKYA